MQRSLRQSRRHLQRKKRKPAVLSSSAISWTRSRSRRRELPRERKRLLPKEKREERDSREILRVAEETTETAAVHLVGTMAEDLHVETIQLSRCHRRTRATIITRLITAEKAEEIMTL